MSVKTFYHNKFKDTWAEIFTEEIIFLWKQEYRNEMLPMKIETHHQLKWNLWEENTHLLKNSETGDLKLKEKILLTLDDPNPCYQTRAPLSSTK